MRIGIGIVAVVASLWLAGASEAAAEDDDLEDGKVVPTLSLGLGGFFPMSPRADPHIIGSALLGLQTRLLTNEGHRLSLITEIGYSGDRRGYLAGRHFVAGVGVRYGHIFGTSGLLQLALGRTGGERSFGIRVGARFDIFNYVGAIVLYEGRHVQTGPDADLVGRGVRFEVFFDPVRFARVIAELD